jgi:hypothetical protein
MFRFTQSDATAAKRNVSFYAASTTDGYTAVTTGITSPTITIYKNGTGAAVTPVSPSVTHLTNGLWSYQLAATDIDTTGMISITIAHASIRTVHLVGYVYSGDAFNAPTTTQTGYLDAAISGRMASYTQPSGFLTTTFPAGTVANTTNITAGTITTVSNRVSANTDQWNGVAVTGMPMPTFTYTTPLTSGQTASAVWDALLASYATANTFGARVVRSSTASITNDVTTNSLGHIAANVHQMQANVVTAAAIATDAIDADALATDAVTEIADGILARDIGSGTNAVVTNERTVRSALRVLRNKSSIATSTLTVTTENDTTTAWTAAVSSDATAIPVTGIDPIL